jgi:Flp pilus assembly pilin Flp
MIAVTGGAADDRWPCMDRDLDHELDRELKLLPQRAETTAAEYALIAAVLVLAIGISLHGLAGKMGATLDWIAGAIR